MEGASLCEVTPGGRGGKEPALGFRDRGWKVTEGNSLDRASRVKGSKRKEDKGRTAESLEPGEEKREKKEAGNCTRDKTRGASDAWEAGGHLEQPCYTLKEPSYPHGLISRKGDGPSRGYYHQKSTPRRLEERGRERESQWTRKSV